MPIVGHQITKIIGKRGVPERNIKISTNVEVKDVVKKEILIADEKRSSLDFEFEFIVQYGEKAGGVNIIGTLFYTDKEVELDKLAKQWKKDKKIDADIIVSILNRAMELGYIESIPLAERLRLPIPLKIPKFSKENENKK
jgi:hypothetical protein